MVQDQLIDYVSSQIKLGVSREAIKAALISAGWVVADVDDTLKKVDSASLIGKPTVSTPLSASSSASASGPTSPISITAKPAQSVTASPASSTPSSTIGGGVATGSRIGAASSSSSPSLSNLSSLAKPAGSQPQMMRVSDLVSSPAASSSPMGSNSAGNMASKYPATKVAAKSPVDNFMSASPKVTKSDPVSTSGKSGGGKAGVIITAIIAIIFAGLAAYFYFGNSALASKVATLTSESNTLNGQISSLQSQMGSSSGLVGQVATLTSSTNELELELSFYSPPAGSTAVSQIPVTISGMLSDSNGLYSITAERGAKIFIATGTNAKTIAMFKPLVGDNVQVVGTYIPGSDEITPVSVTNLSAPAAVITTPVVTASSTGKASTSSKPSTSY
jgi:hypothetical protein